MTFAFIFHSSTILLLILQVSANHMALNNEDLLSDNFGCLKSKGNTKEQWTSVCLGQSPLMF